MYITYNIHCKTYFNKDDGIHKTNAYKWNERFNKHKVVNVLLFLKSCNAQIFYSCAKIQAIDLNQLLALW